MGVGLIRAGVLLGILAIGAWSWLPHGQTTLPVAQVAAGAPLATDDGGDWLPALVPARLLLAGLVVLMAVVRVPLPRPVVGVPARTIRPRAPPVR
jgi:hypothetical protein